MVRNHYDENLVSSNNMYNFGLIFQQFCLQQQQQVSTYMLASACKVFLISNCDYGQRSLVLDCGLLSRLLTVDLKLILIFSNQNQDLPFGFWFITPESVTAPLMQQRSVRSTLGHDDDDMEEKMKMFREFLKAVSVSILLLPSKLIIIFRWRVQVTTEDIQVMEKSSTKEDQINKFYRFLALARDQC